MAFFELVGIPAFITLFSSIMCIFSIMRLIRYRQWALANNRKGDVWDMTVFAAGWGLVAGIAGFITIFFLITG